MEAEIGSPKKQFLHAKTEMNPSPLPSRHYLHLRGIASRYAPHVMMMGTLLVIGLGLLLLTASRPSAGTLIPGLLFAVGALLFLIPVYLGLAAHPREVEVTPAGLKWTDNESEHEVDWEDIREVYRYERITNQTFREAHLILVLTDGHRLDLNQSLSDFNKLGDTVQSAVCTRRAPALRADLQTGSAEFGPVTLRPSGLSFNETTLTWDVVDQIVVARGHLNVCLKSPMRTRWESVAIGGIPNFLVLLSLIQEVSPVRISTSETLNFLR